MPRAAALALAALLLPPLPAAAQTCVDVRIGEDRFYDCLNQRLRAAVPGAEARPDAASAAPYSAAGTPSHAQGLFNEQALRQRLGSAYGHAARPQRPPDPGRPAGPPPLAPR